MNESVLIVGAGSGLSASLARLCASKDNLSASGTSPEFPAQPYSISTDENIYNTGYFVGYNYSINKEVRKRSFKATY